MRWAGAETSTSDEKTAVPQLSLLPAVVRKRKRPSGGTGEYKLPRSLAVLSAKRAMLCEKCDRAACSPFTRRACAEEHENNCIGQPDKERNRRAWSGRGTTWGVMMRTYVCVRGVHGRA